MNPHLQTLAERHRIGLSYHDVRGNFHQLDEQVLCTMLLGLGVLESSTPDNNMLANALAFDHTREWRTGLPPVQILYQNEAGHTELVLPVCACQQCWAWEIECEDGTRQRAEFVPDRLGPPYPTQDDTDGPGARCAVIDGRELHRLHLPVIALEAGYHTLRLSTSDEQYHSVSDINLTTTLIVAPRQAYLHTDQTSATSPAVDENMLAIGSWMPSVTRDLPENRYWGIGLQLYALRSLRNWGIGDFTDLKNACTQLAGLGADLVGINPLHTLFPLKPEEASPYSPSSRQFLNPLYIDVEALPEFQLIDIASILGPDWASRLEHLRHIEFVDYSAVTQYKGRVLEHLFEQFERGDLVDSGERHAAFEVFRISGGNALEQLARFQALHQERQTDSEMYQNDRHTAIDTLPPVDSGSVEQFSQRHARQIKYQAWLQWIASEQLESAAEHTRHLGMRVGIYRDLAVGVCAEGADVWAAPPLYVSGVSVGAPPDDFSARGQDWGLPPWHPHQLRQNGYAPFIAMLRSNMACAGALRIDHVMGLRRLFWIPAGAPPSVGTYVQYPFEELLAIVALESQRQHCEVIGEDLGTVPDGLREHLAAANVLSYRLLYFEKFYEGDHSFRRPDHYPEGALVSANTHDLPTLRAFWTGQDLVIREQLDLFPSVSMKDELWSEREQDRWRLLQALCDEGLWSYGPQHAPGCHSDLPAMTDDLIKAVYSFLARTPARIVLASIEDLIGQVEQVNLPGTDRDIYPNWRRRLSVPVELWNEHDALRGCATAIHSNRNRDNDKTT